MLDEIEAAWLREAPVAIRSLVDANTHESFYAAAFWLLYCDEVSLLAPALAVNTESAIVTHNDNDEPWSTRWVPAEWRWPVLDLACDAVKPLYERLSGDMSGASSAEWDALMTAHDQMLARVARGITRALHEPDNQIGISRIPAQFVVAVIDDQRESPFSEDLLRSSVEPHQLGLFRDILDE